MSFMASDMVLQVEALANNFFQNMVFYYIVKVTIESI